MEENKKQGKSFYGCSIFSLLILIAAIVWGIVTNSANARVVAIIVAVIFFIVACVVFFVETNSSRRNKLPELKTTAKLVSKSQEQTQFDTNNYLTFELDDQSRKVFQVKKLIYALFLEGETGVLTYKEDGAALEFLDFKRDI